MSSRRYRFTHTFTVAAPREQVHAALVDLEHYPDWWPQVRAVARLDDDRAWVVVRSALPYALDLVLSARSRDPHLLEVGIEGALRGWARYHLHDAGPGATSLRFEQEVVAEARTIRWASYVVRPLLVWNHDRMLAGAVRGLERRLGAVGQPSAVDQPSAEIAAS